MNSSDQKPDLLSGAHSGNGGKRILASLEHGPAPQLAPNTGARLRLNSWTAGVVGLMLLMSVLAWQSHRQATTQTQSPSAPAQAGTFPAPPALAQAVAPLPTPAPAGNELEPEIVSAATIYNDAPASTGRATSSPASSLPPLPQADRVAAGLPAAAAASAMATAKTAALATADTSAFPAASAEPTAQPTAQATAVISAAATVQATAQASGTAGAAPPARPTAQATEPAPLLRSPGKTGVTQSAQPPRQAQSSVLAANTAPVRDSDVALLTALVAHAYAPTTVVPERSRDIVVRKDDESTANLLQRCKQLGLIEGMLCRSRICSGRWDSEPDCRAPAR